MPTKRGQVKRAASLRDLPGAASVERRARSKDRRAPSQTRPWRVAIIGGGCAGLSAAWQLAKRKDRFDVHVFEKSWGLGGKGASYRDDHGRIHEHGLHVWLGFYDNAFRMMRDCYAEAQRLKLGPNHTDPRGRLAHASFDEAFFPESHIGVAVGTPGDGRVWSGHLPPMDGLPGDDIDEATNPFTLANYLARCIHLARTLMLSVIDAPKGSTGGGPRPEGRSAVDEDSDLHFGAERGRDPKAFVESMTKILKAGVLTSAAGLLQAVTIFENWLRSLNFGPQSNATVLSFVEAIAAQTRKMLRDLVAVDEETRWKTEVIDIVMTIAVGLYRDKVLFSSEGLDALNQIDYREWLSKHGATKTSLESSFLTGIYDLVFAYRGGDRMQPALAAGVALRGALRMFFTYRGAMFWRMGSGMGDAVFAPLYRVLSQDYQSDIKPSLGRVSFHFRHRLERFEVKHSKSRDGRYVSKLHFQIQGPQVRPGEVLDHMGCWSKPKADLSAGDVGWTGVDHGEWDAVIVATGFDDFKALCQASTFNEEGVTDELPGSWWAMLRKVQTVATQVAQLWLRADLHALGWHRGPVLVSGLAGPFDTWADMSHTLPTEQRWRELRPAAPGDVGTDEGTRSVAYFCGAATSSASMQTVERDLRKFLSGSMKRIWPSSGGSSVLRVGNHTFFELNHEGSNRYSQSLPGSIDARISPLDAGFSNMTVAGDWTACGLDAGCVEAAVMSGMLAACAVSGDETAIDEIVGYHHP